MCSLDIHAISGCSAKTHMQVNLGETYLITCVCVCITYSSLQDLLVGNRTLR